MKEITPQAIALCRVSTKSQLLDGNLAPQEERIIRAAAILDVKIVQWWKLAVSSRKGKNLQRKDILEMYRFCKANRNIKFLIVDECDRFMRSISEYYWWRVEFEQIGVQLRHANRPDADPTEDRAVFDELIDVYRAESSNSERINKTPEKMMAKIRLGYYPSNPHSGFKTSETPGLHLPDEPNWSALRDTFKDMVIGKCDMEEGLKLLHRRGFRTKNYGPKAVGGRCVDMYRFKELMCDPYYCGVVKMKDWPVVNENGLHQAMVTKEEHQILVNLAQDKGKKFLTNRNNPKFPLSNILECQPCKEKGATYPRIVGSDQNNGRKGKWRRYYARYWCRTCSKGILRDDLHAQIDGLLDSLRLTPDQIKQLKSDVAELWAKNEKIRIEQMVKAERHLMQLKQTKNDLISKLDPKSKHIKDMEEAIEDIKHQIDEATLTLAQSKSYDHDFNAFFDYALDLITKWVDNFWSLDKATIERFKQVVFSGELMLDSSRNVYTTATSPIFIKGNRLNEEARKFVEVEESNQLHYIIGEILRWRSILGTDYSQYIISSYQHSFVQAV